MHMKARYLTIGILLITLSLATFQAPLLAQDTGDPAVTEDPCPAILDAAMQSQDANATDATDDPALTACLDALDTAGTDATDATDQVNQDSQATAEPIPGATQPPADTAAYHSITVMNRTQLLARFWLSWHVPPTGTLLALGSGTILGGKSGKLPIPSSAFAIGVRVELYTIPTTDMVGERGRSDQTITWRVGNNCLFGLCRRSSESDYFPRCRLRCVRS